MRRRFFNTNNTDAFDSLNYLSFTSEQDNSTISLTSMTSPDIKYSLNGGKWVQWDYSTITLNTGDVVYMKGDNSSGFSSASNYNQFKMTGKIAASGNIMSLLYEEDFEERLIIPRNYCYYSMFQDCTSLTTAPKLPATTLAQYCYACMFEGCTNLTTAPELPATKLAQSCYSRMLYGTNALPDCSNIDFTNEAVVTSCGLKGLFANTKVTDADLERILPKNNEGKYCLPVVTLASGCYYFMFDSCTSLTTAPELPATKLASNCYQQMFQGCTSLTTAPKLPATTLIQECYYYMFKGCTNLTTAPELPATKLASNCYSSMFDNCSKLNYIKMLATDISASNCLSGWVSGVASSGTFVKHPNMISLPSGGNGIPYGWTVEDNFMPYECTSLTITADNVSGRQTNTTIYYTAVVNGTVDTGESVNKTITGTAVSDNFPQNTSETEEVTRTISYTYMGVTATTTITQGTWVSRSYTLDLNSNWQLSTSIYNPDSSTYDGVYESYSNKGVNNTAAIMYIDIDGYTDFDLYIRSYAESNWDYVMVSQLDQTINNNTSYSNSTLVKAHTRGNQKAGNTISDYTKVSFTGIDEGQHRITIVYRKDSSSHSGDDRGYLLIPKNQ